MVTTSIQGVYNETLINIYVQTTRKNIITEIIYQKYVDYPQTHLLGACLTTKFTWMEYGAVLVTINQSMEV